MAKPITTTTARADRRLLGALLGLGAILATAVPAGAHAVLTSTTPEEDETVSEALPAVILRFNEPVDFPRIQVTGPEGQDVTDGTPINQGETIEQSLIELPETGEYTVSYRVMSEDDHPIQGTFSFDYQGPVAGGEPTPVDPPAPDVTEGGTAEPRPTADPVPPADTGDETDWVLPALLIAVVVAVGFGAAMALRRTS